MLNVPGVSKLCCTEGNHCDLISKLGHFFRVKEDVKNSLNSTTFDTYIDKR